MYNFLFSLHDNNILNIKQYHHHYHHHNHHQAVAPFYSGNAKLTGNLALSFGESNKYDTYLPKAALRRSLSTCTEF